MEAGLVTLAKIVGVLLTAISAVPIVFLLSSKDRGEPAAEETFDSEH